MILFLFPFLSLELTRSSLAFSTLADPCLWPAPSPLDSPDPLDAFDSILYPTFEREIVSGLRVFSVRSSNWVTCS